MPSAPATLLLASLLAVTVQALLTVKPNSMTLARPLHTNFLHAQCHRLDYPGITGLTPTNCEPAANALCEDLTTPVTYHIPRNRWNWVDLGGCAVGFYLRNVDERPSMEMCEEVIFGEMIAECAYNSSVNAGTVNVAVLPDLAQNGTAIMDHGPMYMLAPERQTL